MWEAGDPVAAAHRTWVRELSRSLTPHALPGTYANLLGDDPAQAEHAYSPHAARLLRTKDRYDPDGAFRALPLPPRADSRDMAAVHDMCRRKFDRLRTLLTAVPVAGPDVAGRVGRVAGHGRFLIDLLHAHHGSEDALVWPKLTAREPAGTRAVVSAMAAQHQDIDRRHAPRQPSPALAAHPGERERADAFAAPDALLPPLREHLALEEGRGAGPHRPAPERRRVGRGGCDGTGGGARRG